MTRPRLDGRADVRQAGRMSRRLAMTPARRLLAGVALAALALPLAACSGEDQVQAFCDDGESAIAEIDAAGSLGDDPEAFAEAVADAREGFEGVEAPDEIADDWAVFTRTFGDLDDALQDIDPSDQEAFTAALTEFAETANSDDLSTAGDNLSTYISENCDA